MSAINGLLSHLNPFLSNGQRIRRQMRMNMIPIANAFMQLNAWVKPLNNVTYREYKSMPLHIRIELNYWIENGLRSDSLWPKEMRKLLGSLHVLAAQQMNLFVWLALGKRSKKNVFKIFHVQKTSALNMLAPITMPSPGTVAVHKYIMLPYILLSECSWLNEWGGQ